MPETGAQWLWFVFFAGGAIGGWTALLLRALDAINGRAAR